MKTYGAEWIAEEIARRKAWKGPQFKIYRATLIVHHDDNEDNKMLCTDLMGHLRALNFYVGRDHGVAKNYPRITHLFYQGAHQTSTLRFNADRCKTGMKIEFHPALNPDPKDGRLARHAMLPIDKFTRKEQLVFRMATRRLKHALLAAGFYDVSDPVFEDPRDQVEWTVRDCWHFKGEASIDVERKYVESYNAKDRDGRRLVNGALRYFRHYDGRLYVGRVYFRLNSQWIVIAGGTVYHKSSYEFFSDPTGEPRRQVLKAYVERHMKKAVEKMEFERAIPIRNQLLART